MSANFARVLFDVVELFGCLVSCHRRFNNIEGSDV